MPSSGCVPCGVVVALGVIQCRVWRHGVVGRRGGARVGVGVSGGWRVWVVLRLVWNVTVSWVSRCSVPRLWWWVVAEGVGDRVGQQRVRADLDEGAVVGPRPRRWPG